MYFPDRGAYALCMSTPLLTPDIMGRSEEWLIMWIGDTGAVWPANLQKLDKDCRTHILTP